VASSIDRVKQSIRERLDEIETERDQLMKALEALSGSTTNVGGRRGRPPGAGAGAGRPRADKRAAGRRAPRGQRRQQVIDALQDGEKGPSAIARDIGDVNPTQISGLLRQLASEGVVSRTAEGKWQLTAATQHEQAPPVTENGAGAPAESSGGDSFPN
jgi:DNA-binding transcriptional ArsR family regulator